MNCKNYSPIDKTDTSSWRRSLCAVGCWSWRLSNQHYLCVHAHICSQEGRKECLDTFGLELHLCCQYTWQWPRVTQSFHPSGPSTPWWVNYLTSEPGTMRKLAELDQKFQPRFQNVQSHSQMFHGSFQHTASPESSLALTYNKVGLRVWDLRSTTRAVWPERCWKTIKCNGWHGESNALNLWLYLVVPCVEPPTCTRPGFTSCRCNFYIIYPYICQCVWFLLRWKQIIAI